jgi:predicted HD phosphohydrolase
VLKAHNDRRCVAKLAGMVTPAQSVEEVHSLLARYAAEEIPIAGDVPAVLISHGVQCAEVLAADRPGDLALQVAGLLHDIGLLLVPGDELGHPRHGADYVRDLFGGRCAQLIAIHVDAQRYLESTEDGYRVTPPPTASFAQQPRPMTPAEQAEFSEHPMFADAIALRRADDRASDCERREGDLGAWVDAMRTLARHQKE